MNPAIFAGKPALQSDEVIGAQLVNSPATPLVSTGYQRVIEALVSQPNRAASVNAGLRACEILHMDLRPSNILISAPAWNVLRADAKWDEIHVLTIEDYARVNWLPLLTAEQTTHAAGRPAPTRIASGSSLTLDSQAIRAEADDEGFDGPPAEALEGARHVLRRFPCLRGLNTDIYPTPDAEVAILASGSRARSSVLLQCDGDGQVRCSVNVDGRHRRALYDKESFSELRDNFIMASLIELGA